MSEIKTVILKLDRTKSREKKIIDLLEREKHKGINNKETIIMALQFNNNEVLRELREIKLILLMGNNLSPQQEAELEIKAKELEEIASTDDDIDPNELTEF